MTRNVPTVRVRPHQEERNLEESGKGRVWAHDGRPFPDPLPYLTQRTPENATVKTTVDGQ